MTARLVRNFTKMAQDALDQDDMTEAHSALRLALRSAAPLVHPGFEASISLVEKGTHLRPSLNARGTADLLSLVRDWNNLGVGAEKTMHLIADLLTDAFGSQVLEGEGN